MTAPEALFDERTRRKLAQLMLVAARVRAGAQKGERRSAKRGTSIEFADYRNYAQGDDLRRLDWNIYARLDRPYIKVFEDEEDLAVHILLDCSASMNWPLDESSQAAHKFRFAQRLAAGLGYLALATNDPLSVQALHAGGTASRFGPVRGSGQQIALLRYLHSLSAAGRVDLNAALQSAARRGQRPGLCFILSDLLAPSGVLAGLNALLSQGHEVTLVHLLAPDEVDPALGGDLRLIDAETGAAQEVTIDSGLRDVYCQRLAAWRTALQQDCHHRGAHYLPLQTDSAWEKVLLHDFRRLGLVR